MEGKERETLIRDSVCCEQACEKIAEGENVEMKDMNELLNTADMLVYTNENCTGCNKCVRVCPTLVSNIAQEGKIWVNGKSCVACGACKSEAKRS